MILSFHPIFVADKNIICAGRQPDNSDLSAIKEADAVILPQGCSKLLYSMAKNNCQHVFPNFDARFQYPGKIDQISLFQKTNTPHPKTETFLTVNAFYRRFGPSPDCSMFHFPFVFKFDWGGEGELVYLVPSLHELNRLIGIAKEYERTGQSGFLFQETVHTGGRSLRISVIGQRFISFWRVLDEDNGFLANISKGAKIDHNSFPELQETARQSVFNFCKRTKINLAGFDILYSFDTSGNPETLPLFLEMNYFFGRRGLGGSETFYGILIHEIKHWLNEIGLAT